MKKVSVILIARNEDQKLPTALERIRQQSYQGKMEIICVNDGSYDRTTSTCEKFGVKVVELTKPRGISFARSVGLRKSTGEVAFFVDADLYLREDAVERAVACLESDPRIGGVCGRYISFYGTSDLNILRDVRRWSVYGKKDKPRMISLDDFTTFSGGLCAFKCEALGGAETDSNFAGVACEDIFVALQVLSQGYTLLYDPEFFGQHDDFLDLGGIARKMLSEVRGAGRLLLASKDMGISLPFLHFFTSYPLILNLGIALSLFCPVFLPLAGLALLREIVGALPTLRAREYKLRYRFAAFAYLLIQEFVKGVYFPLFLLRSNGLDGLKLALPTVVWWEQRKWGICWRGVKRWITRKNTG